MKDFELDNRRYVIGGVAIFIVVVYIIRLFMLQITSDDYKKSADSNAFLKKIEYPSRGVITDRKGRLMVFNQPAYDVMVVMNEVGDHLDTLELCEALNITKEDFIKHGTATEEMMDFLSFAVRYGASTTVAGATSSGKTTLTGWLLTTIPHNKRIFTIEAGSRELDLVERDENGKIINKVIHTITRESEDEKKSITQDNLLDMSLRFHPDYIVVGEMRSSEADSAQEAARTGHTVITTIHSNSCEATWRRMVTLCKRKYPNVDDTVILNLVTEAFPIVVYAKQLENKQRRIMEIMECEIKPDGEREYHTLYRYKISENRVEDGKFIIKGEHIKVEDPSPSLQRRMLENGASVEELNRFLRKGEHK